jgi:hypothetical protein
MAKTPQSAEKSVRVDSGGYGISWNDDVDISEYELWTNGVEVVTTPAETTPTENPRRNAREPFIQSIFQR